MPSSFTTTFYDNVIMMMSHFLYMMMYLSYYIKSSRIYYDIITVAELFDMTFFYAGWMFTLSLIIIMINNMG